MAGPLSLETGKQSDRDLSSDGSPALREKASDSSPACGRTDGAAGSLRNGQDSGERAGSSVTAGDRSLVGRVGWSGLAQMMPMLVQLALTPYFIRVLGLDGFGLWSLILVFLGTLTALDGGIGASLARFFAVHAAKHEREAAGRLLLSAVALFVLLAVVVSIVAVGFAETLTGWLNLSPELHSQLVEALRWLGILLLLALVNGAVVAILQANHRFGRLAASTAAAQLAYIIAALGLLQQGGPATVLVGILSTRYIVGIVVGFALARRLVRFRRPLFSKPSERAEFRAYAGRMQLSSMTSLLNGEVDALVVAALLPLRYVGIFVAAHQVASAARSLPLYAFPPILTTIANSFAKDGLAGARTEFDRIQARWLPLVLGYTAVAAGAALLAVPIWLGDEFQLAGALAAILALGYGIQVALTGIRTCFVRSIGRPGLETRYSVFSTIVNVALTLPFALIFGVTGVVAATAIALTGASLYFARLCRQFGIRDRPPHPGWLPAIAMGAAVTVLGALAVRETNWHGPLAAATVGVPALVGLATIVLPLRLVAARAKSPRSEGG
jgi:O-antigen/teichoic acid export membrane protein